MARGPWRRKHVIALGAEAMSRAYGPLDAAAKAKIPCFKWCDRKPLKRRARLRPIGRHGYRPIPEPAKEQVRLRSGGQCEAITEEGARCVANAKEFHHYLARSQGGRHTVGNLRHLCLFHHWICKSQPNRAHKLRLIRVWNHLEDGHNPA